VTKNLSFNTYVARCPQTPTGATNRRVPLCAELGSTDTELLLNIFTEFILSRHVPLLAITKTSPLCGLRMRDSAPCRSGRRTCLLRRCTRLAWSVSDNANASKGASPKASTISSGRWVPGEELR